MAGNAQIGALHVLLGLNSAQFTAGLKNAQGALGKFGAVAARGFAAVAAGATLAAGALGVAVKGAIDHADALSKASQKAGVTVEALSRLEYAAKLSDVSLEGLTGGLQKLSKGMADAAGGKGPAAAFKALGIAVTESNGQLRDGNEVFADIADRFSRLEDGATKTALAMQIFGKSGAELIPLLNSGRDGLKSMADESDRLGATISTKTAKAAEEFNDTLTRIQVAMQGMVNKIMVDVLPTLQNLADTLASPGFQEAVTWLSVNLVGAINLVANAFANAYGFAKQFADFVKNIPVLGLNTGVNIGGVQFGPGATPAPSKEPSYNTVAPGLIDSTFAGLGSTFDSPAAMFASFKKPLVIPPFDTGGAVKSLEPLDLGIETTTDKVTTLADTIGGPLSDAISGFADAVLSGTNPLKAFGDQLGNIGKSLMNAGIQGLVNSLLGGIGGGGGLSFAGSAFRFGGPSFDGGGYTGMGSRAGGIDGKGGFLGMLHPNETVLDHSKGQGGGITMNFNITGSKSDAAAIASVVRNEARGVYLQMQRNPDRR